MDTTVVEALARVPMFSGLDRRHLENLAKQFKDQVFPAGSIVIHEGSDRGVGFFVVVEGDAAVSVAGTEVARLHPGSQFGEVALISDRVRTATVTAVTDLRCLVMTRWNFRAFVQSDVDVAWKLLERLALLLYEAPAAAPSVAAAPSGPLD
jgi:voltage-gated potassium channel